MPDAKPILDPYIADFYSDLSNAVSIGYEACNDLFTDHAVLGNFLTAMQQRSNLLNCFVEHALMTLVAENKGFNYEFKPNDAKNFWHLRLHKDNLTLTAHFIGRNSDRKRARSASHRAVLAAMNYDLFDSDIPEELSSSHIYCHLLHGGFTRPDSICLAIPTLDQKNHSHTMPLPISSPNLTEKEQIKEDVIFSLLRQFEDGDESDATG